MQCRPVPVATPRAPCIASSSTHEEFSQDRQRTTRCDPCDLVGRSRVLRATLPLGFGYVTTPLHTGPIKTKQETDLDTGRTRKNISILVVLLRQASGNGEGYTTRKKSAMGSPTVVISLPTSP